MMLVRAKLVSISLELMWIMLWRGRMRGGLWSMWGSVLVFLNWRGSMSILLS